MLIKNEYIDMRWLSVCYMEYRSNTIQRLNNSKLDVKGSI